MYIADGADEFYAEDDVIFDDDVLDTYDEDYDPFEDDVDETFASEAWPYDEDDDEAWDDLDDFAFDLDDSEARGTRDHRGRRGGSSISRALSRQNRLKRMSRRPPPRRGRPRYAGRPRGRRPDRGPSQQVRHTTKIAKQASLKADVLGDATKIALKKQDERMSRTESSLAAHAALNQLQESFPDMFQNDLVKTIVPLGSLALLKPKKGTGAAGYLSDPRVWGPAATVLIAGLKELRGRNERSATKEIVGLPFAQLATGATTTLAQQVMAAGKPVDNQSLLFFSVDSDVVAVDQLTGIVTAKKKGNTIIKVFTPNGDVVKDIAVAVMA